MTVRKTQSDPMETPQAVEIPLDQFLGKSRNALVSYAFAEFVSAASDGKFDKKYKNLDNIYKMKDKRTRYVEFAVALFGFDKEQAEQAYEQTLRMNFNSAAQDAALPESHLCIPKGMPEKYLGKGKSGEIYAFLHRVYPYREGAEPLTIDGLKELDPKALIAFRGRRRVAPPPLEMVGLTDPDRGTRQEALLERHGIDLSTAQGVAEAKRIMSSISNLLYRTP